MEDVYFTHLLKSVLMSNQSAKSDLLSVRKIWLHFLIQLHVLICVFMKPCHIWILNLREVVTAQSPAKTLLLGWNQAVLELNSVNDWNLGWKCCRMHKREMKKYESLSNIPLDLTEAGFQKWGKKRDMHIINWCTFEVKNVKIWW